MDALFGGGAFNLTQLKSFLDGLETDVTDIHVYINSGGGYIDEGWAIYDKLKASGKSITTIGEGLVGSIATIVYMAAPVERRKLHQNTKFFIHNPYWAPDSPTPMEGDALINLGEDLKNEQQKILDFYAQETGSTIESIQPLMQKATNLTSTEAINMGFASEIITSIVNYTPYKLVAMVARKDKQKETQMEKSFIDKLAAGFKNLENMFKRKFLNMDLKTTDADGNPVNLTIESDTEDLVGKPAFIIDAAGNQSPAPDGDYTDDKKRVITILAGKVGEVSTPEEETTEETVAKLNAEITALKASNATLTTDLEAEKAVKTELQNSLNTIKPEFENLKSTLIGAGFDFENPEQSFKGAKGVESGYGAEMAKRIKAKSN